MSVSANDRRLIEDYLPIEPISAEASRETCIRGEDRHEHQ